MPTSLVPNPVAEAAQSRGVRLRKSLSSKRTLKLVARVSGYPTVMPGSRVMVLFFFASRFAWFVQVVDGRVGEVGYLRQEQQVVTTK